MSKKFDKNVIVKFVLNIAKPDLDGDWVNNFPFKKLRYIETDYVNSPIKSYLFELIDKNIDLFKSGETDPSKYVEPVLKKFRVSGEERYSQAVADLYTYDIESYSEVYAKEILETDFFGDDMLYIYEYGKFDRKDILDTWDSEVNIDSIEEITDEVEINESKLGDIKYNNNIINQIMYETDTEQLGRIIEVLTKRRDLLKNDNKNK